MAMMTTEAHGTVFFEQKIPTAVKYANQTASIFMPFTYDPADFDGNERRATAALASAKRLVAEAAGIEYDVSFTDEGIEEVTLLLEAAFGAMVEDVAPRTTSAAPAAAAPARQGGGGVEVLKQIDAPLPDWLTAEYVANAKGVQQGEKFWDNRKYLPNFGGDGNPKAPWFKGADSKAGIWPPR